MPRDQCRRRDANDLAVESRRLWTQYHPDDAHLATILWDGVYGSAMPPWRQLDKSDLAALTAYVRSLEAQMMTPVSMSSEELDAASKLFAANCVSCHGDHGAAMGRPLEVLSRRRSTSMSG